MRREPCDLCDKQGYCQNGMVVDREEGGAPLRTKCLCVCHGKEKRP